MKGCVTDVATICPASAQFARFDASATGKLLESLGARSVELVES